METKQQDALNGALEAAARELADANHVEIAWLLRGIADALTLEGDDHPSGEAGAYYPDYIAGWVKTREALALRGFSNPVPELGPPPQTLPERCPFYLAETDGQFEVRASRSGLLVDRLPRDDSDPDYDEFQRQAIQLRHAWQCIIAAMDANQAGIKVRLTAPPWVGRAAETLRGEK